MFFMAKAADKLIEVVVFPTPPFWLATAIILFIFRWMFHVEHRPRRD